MAKVDKTFVPPMDIHVTKMDEHGTPGINPDVNTGIGYPVPEYVTDKDGRLRLNSVSYTPPLNLKPLRETVKEIDEDFASVIEDYGTLNISFDAYESIVDRLGFIIGQYREVIDKLLENKS